MTRRPPHIHGKHAVREGVASFVADLHTIRRIENGELTDKDIAELVRKYRER